MKKTAFHFLLVVFLSSGSALAWSSPASRTQHRIKEMALAIQLYEMDHGHLPSSTTYAEDLQKEGLIEARRSQDTWNQPFIYRVPGKGEAFNLYSIGPDGIDNQGAGDDITASGVNDGYHWKETWPEGRRISGLALLLGTLCLLLGFFFRWSVVLPIAGIVAGPFMIKGCILLHHPGTSGPPFLEGDVLFLSLFLLACLLFLFRALRQPSASTDSLPSFLSEAQIRELLALMEPSQKLQVIRYRLPARPSKRHCQEMTAFELKDLILHSVMAKRLSGGNLAVHLPITGRTLIGNPDGLYWLDTNP